MNRLTIILLTVFHLFSHVVWGQKEKKIYEKVRFQLKDTVWSSYFYIRETNFAKYKKEELCRDRFRILMGEDSLLSVKDIPLIRKNMRFKSKVDITTWFYGDTLEVYNQHNIVGYKFTRTKGKIKTIEYLDHKKRRIWADTYVYDHHGNCIEKREFSRGKIRRRVVSQYDAHKSVVREFVYIYSDESEDVASDLSDSWGVIEHVYDQKNNPKYDTRHNLVYDSLYTIHIEPYGDTTLYYYQEVNIYAFDSLNRCTRSNFTHFEYDSLNRVTRKLTQRWGRLVGDEKYIYTSSGDTSFVSTVASSHLTLDNKVDVNTSNRYQLITYTKSYVYDEQGRKRAVIWRREGKLCWMDFFMYR